MIDEVDKKVIDEKLIKKLIVKKMIIEKLIKLYCLKSTESDECLDFKFARTPYHPIFRLHASFLPIFGPLPRT